MSALRSLQNAQFAGQDGHYSYARPEGGGAVRACHRDIGRGDSLIDKAGDLWYDEDNP